MMIFSEVHYWSEALASRGTVSVLLPQRGTGEHSGEYLPPFRVLYLLHGYSDDQTAWMRWTSIERYVEGLNLAVIMPAGGNSFYTDMAHGGKYFTFLTEELPLILHDLFPLSQKREDTFIAGLSMGGYGAFKLAMSRPDLYAAAASLSGALDMGHEMKRHHEEIDEFWLENMRNIFGNLDMYDGGPNDLFALSGNLAKSEQKPRLYQFCGRDDFLYQDNLRFRDFIRPLGFDHTYDESAGGHTWDLWDKEIQKVLDWLQLSTKVQ
jgi:putative tributyrin esterase